MNEWYIYLVRCQNGNLYTGITKDVARRFLEHQRGKGAKYLRGRGPLTLELQRKVGGQGLALSVERRVKKLNKDRKEELIKRRKLLKAIIEEIGSGSKP